MLKHILQTKILWLGLLLLGLLFGVNYSLAATSLASRLQGYILLQVESLGEAWYVIPKEEKMVYMKDGAVAYQIMREVSLGITNANLAKIPVGIEARFNDVDTDSDGLSDKLEEGLETDPNKADTDNDGFKDGEEINNNFSPVGPNKLVYDQNLVNRLKGYILLQVEKQGQAWYVNPKDGKRYYMQDGPAAYNIMRYLSLGITNANLNLIPKSSRVFNVDTSGNSSNQGNQNNNNNNNNSTSTPPGNNQGGNSGGGGGGGGSSTPPPSADTQNPTSPSNLSASASGTQISLSWTASTDNVGVVGYQILRSTTNGSGYTQIATSNTTSYTNTNLNIGTTYYYVVKAYDAAGNVSSNSSQTQAVAVDNQSPTVPSALTANATGVQIALAWSASTDNVGVTQYIIERSNSAIAGFATVATSTTSVYTNTRLSVNVTYYYRVKAQDLAGNNSGYSEVVSATTNNELVITDTQKPSAPSNLSASASGTTISLSWTASTDNVGVVGYQILRSTTNGSGHTQIGTSNTTSYTNTNLNIGTTYYYLVRAYDAAGNVSLDSLQVQATVPIPADTQAPTAPTNLVATPANREVALSWSASTDNTAVTGYQVLRSTTNGSGYVQQTTVNTTVYVDTGLTNGTTYYYVIKAYDAAGNVSQNSNQAQAIPADSQAPSSPTNLTATVSGTQSTLSWSASIDNVGVTGYQVLRSTTNGSGYTQVTTLNTTSYTNTGLTSGVTYYYVIRAYDAAGNYSGNSNQASATVGTITPPTGSVSITGASGTMSAGQTVTISGSGFGVKTTAAPVVYDTMESGSFSPAWQSTNQLVVSSNSANRRNANSNYYGTINFQGNLSTYPPPANGSGYGANGFFTGPNGQLSDSWYGRYWFKLDNNLDWGTTAHPDYSDINLANVKIFRLWNPGDYNENFVVATQGYSGGSIIYLGENTGDAAYYAGTNIANWSKGTWHVFDFAFKESTVGATNGIFKMWLDGKLVEENNSVMTRNAFSVLKRPFILGFYNSAADSNTDRDDFYIDDAYIDGTWSRIMLCDQSVWNDAVSRHCEIQPAQNSWSNTSVQIAMNPGSFTSGQTAYLYVVDSNGNVNTSGYPVVISGTTTPDTTLPSTPTNLSASASGTTISLSWTASTDNAAVARYLVERSTSASSGFSQIATPTTNSYTDSGLNNSTTYYYRVRAQDTSNNISSSYASANATTGSGTPPGGVSITGTSGIFNNGQTITISGSGFGTKSTVAPLNYDTMESSDFSTAWQSHNHLVIGSDSANRRHANSTYYGTHNFQGNLYQSAGFFTGSNSQVRDTWYGRYWFKLDNNWDWGTTGEPAGDGNLANVKIFRLFSPADINEDFVVATEGFSGGGIIYKDENTVDPLHYADTNISEWTKNTWHVFDFAFKEGTLGGTNGIFKMWFNGKLVANTQTLMTRQNFDLLKRPLILGFYNSWFDGNSDRDDFYIDDAYIDETWSRIMLCNQATWNDSVFRHCEIQAPQTIWNNSSIQFSANTGSFSSGQTVYLYVIDNNGNVNTSGYPIQIASVLGDSITSCNTQDQETINWTSLPENILVRGCGSSIYAISGGQRVYIPSLEVLRRDYPGQRIYNVSDTLLSSYPIVYR